MVSASVTVVILAIAVYILYPVRRPKPMYTLKKHHPGDCRQVSGIDFGSEDMEVTQDGLAFITSGLIFPAFPDTFHAYYREKKVKGQIFLFDFKKPNAGAKPLKIRPSKTFDPKTFQPHGMSMLEDKVKGKHLLYVVNHVSGAEDRVEKFRFIPEVKELEHLRFFNDSMFHTLNDLAVTGEDQFYASKYLHFRSAFLSYYENSYPMGALYYVDTNGVREVVTGLYKPNGVTLSKDGRLLYVAAPNDGSLFVYERQRDNGLRLVEAVHVATMLDNLQLTLSGEVLVAAAHPFLPKFQDHVRRPAECRAPSSVLRLPLTENGRINQEDITELFLDHGDLVSGSSVAMVHSGQLLIGSVIDKLAVCDLYERPRKCEIRE